MFLLRTNISYKFFGSINIWWIICKLNNISNPFEKLKEEGKISRLTNKTFNFDPRLKDGFFAANYFLKSRKIVEKYAGNHIVTMQFFQRRDDSKLCGIDEAIAIDEVKQDLYKDFDNEDVNIVVDIYKNALVSGSCDLSENFKEIGNALDEKLKDKNRKGRSSGQDQLRRRHSLSSL